MSKASDEYKQTCLMQDVRTLSDRALLDDHTGARDDEQFYSAPESTTDDHDVATIAKARMEETEAEIFRRMNGRRNARVRRNYHKAVPIVTASKVEVREAIREAFIMYFRGEDPQFDDERFREACKRGSE